MRRLHVLAASIAILTIFTFQCTTLVAEFFLDAQAVAAVKRGILYGLLLLVPAIMVTGASGFALARRRAHPVIAAKRRRMPLIALNDTATGKIVHGHQVVTLKGGIHPDQKTLERDAMEHFRAAQPRANPSIAFLHADPSQLKPDALYSIDLAKRVLVAHPRPRIVQGR